MEGEGVKKERKEGNIYSHAVIITCIMVMQFMRELHAKCFYEI